MFKFPTSQGYCAAPYTVYFMIMNNINLEKPAVPVAYALLIFEVAAKQGVSKEEIIAGLGVPANVFDQNDARLSLLKTSQLLYQAIKLTNNPALGYEIALHSGITTHGFIGFGLMSFPNGRAAFDFGAQFLKLRLPNLQMRVFDEGPYAVIEVSEATDQGSVRQCVFDLFMLGIARIVTQIVNRPITDRDILELWFDYPEPAYYQAYRDRLPAMRFGMGSNQLRCPQALMAAPLVTANQTTLAQVSEQCERELALLGYSANVVEQVRAILESCSGRYLDLEATADRLHMSSRTLKRKLQQQGMPFQQILDEVRKKASIRLLQNQSMTINAIAARLGFSDPANFRRAFRKWTGCSPSEFRTQQDCKQ